MMSLKIGHITCDNAANNGTMIAEFACCYKSKTIVSAKKIKVKRYCYNMLLITKLRVFLTFLALKWIVRV